MPAALMQHRTFVGHQGCLAIGELVNIEHNGIGFGDFNRYRMYRPLSRDGYQNTLQFRDLPSL
jgi:hypothetical protein